MTDSRSKAKRRELSLLDRALIWADMRREINAMLVEVREWRHELTTHKGKQS